jgi:hypothetical protein
MLTPRERTYEENHEELVLRTRFLLGMFGPPAREETNYARPGGGVLRSLTPSVRVAEGDDGTVKSTRLAEVKDDEGEVAAYEISWCEERAGERPSFGQLGIGVRSIYYARTAPLHPYGEELDLLETAIGVRLPRNMN